MAAIKFWSRGEEFILKISLKTKSPELIRFRVKDSVIPYCNLINDVQEVDGTFDYYCRIPLSGNNTIIEVYNEKNGNMPNGSDKSFSTINGSLGFFDYGTTELEKRLDEGDISDSMSQSFINLAQKFSFNAGILDTGKTYKSNNGKFFIRYVDDIVDYATGQIIPTPFRISCEDGLIEASKKLILPFTVPMRFVLLCHEFSHFYRNYDMNNEVEADIRGLLMYLSLGYPRKEARESFKETFYNNDTDENRKRLQIINKFIDDFENKNYLFND